MVEFPSNMPSSPEHQARMPGIPHPACRALARRDMPGYFMKRAVGSATWSA
jgi:hypothetical protein